MSSPKVTYSYENGSANTIRPTSVTYPDNTGGTRMLTYDYGTAGGLNDKLSRVAKVSSWDEEELSYDYLGLGTFVKSEMNVGFAWSLVTGDSSNPYASLDRFGRVLRNYWYNTGSLAALDDIRYTYDRASNRTTRENLVAKAQTTPQYYDELYGYDGSNRLTQMQRGQLAGTTSITNLKFQQDWGLDPTGNWQAFSEDSDGSGTNDLVQARTANPVNEITDITNTVGTPWVQPGYDAAGNMTTIPQGNEPEEGFVGVYDAWNRLVKLTNEDHSLVAEYAYDGLTRRVTKTIAEDVRHFYYNASWQILEERVNSATTFDRQYVWGLRYIDNCVFRDNPSGRRYALQDANWNVTAIALGDLGATILERYSYSAYGVPAFLEADFTVKADSDYAWDVLYAGYKWDSESGMYQVRYRYLLPELGTWVSRDPIAYRGGDVNLYRYVKNLCIIALDHNGMKTLVSKLYDRNDDDSRRITVRIFISLSVDEKSCKGIKTTCETAVLKTTVVVGIQYLQEIFDREREVFNGEGQHDATKDSRYGGWSQQLSLFQSFKQIGMTEQNPYRQIDFVYEQLGKGAPACRYPQGRISPQNDYHGWDIIYLGGTESSLSGALNNAQYKISWRITPSSERCGEIKDYDIELTKNKERVPEVTESKD